MSENNNVEVVNNEDKTPKIGVLEAIALKQKTLLDTIRAWDEEIERNGYVM